MSIESQTQTGSDKAQTEFSSLDANNFIRGNKAGCLLITKDVQGEAVETAYITVNRTYFEVTEFGTPSKCERHTMSAALETARQNGHTAELAAYQQSSLDIQDAIEFIKNTFELDDKDSKAGFGLSRDNLDDAGDENLTPASAPAEDRNDPDW